MREAFRAPERSPVGKPMVCVNCGIRLSTHRTRCPMDGGRLVERADPLVGELVNGRYRILRKLGEGGMGQVYRGVHEVIGRDVAVKFLDPSLAKQPVHRDRFLREARASNRLHHSNIVDVLDYGQTSDGRVYLVMEYLRGRALDDVLCDGALEVGRALEVTFQVAKALGRAHSLDIVHRDIKPSNIFMVGDHPAGDFAKLIDFGIARMQSELALTATGTVLGTPAYMAPEQIRGERAGPPADLYSLGVVLFESLTGAPPFQGEAPQLLDAHLHAQPPRLGSCRGRADDDLGALVAALLRKDPEQRVQDAYHLLELLEPLRARYPAESVPPGRAVVARASREPPLVDMARIHARLRDQWQANAEGAAGVPAALRPLERRALAVETLRLRLAAHTRQRPGEQSEAAARRARLQAALDVLSRDHSTARRAAQELAARLEAADQAALAAATCVATAGAAWEDRTPQASSPQAALRTALCGLREALSERQIQLRARDQCLSRRDDLRFQLDQLKGRLATVQAERDAVGDPGRDALERQLEAEERALSETVSALPCTLEVEDDR